VVESALRAFDGAIHVLCGVGGVQSQSIAVDKQIIRYQLPRLIFINNIDQKGANPWQVLNQVNYNITVDSRFCTIIDISVTI
jgi:elongation factor G